MEKRRNELKIEGYKEKVEVKKPKKEFKIELVKVGKLEENTGSCYTFNRRNSCNTR